VCRAAFPGRPTPFAVLAVCETLARPVQWAQLAHLVCERNPPMRLLATLALLLASATLTESSVEQQPPTEDARLTAFFKDYLEKEFRLKPLEATRLGDHRFDHLLDDLSDKAHAECLDHTKTTLAELKKQIDYKKLSRSGQIDFEIFEHHLERTLWLAANTKPFEDDPRIYNDYITDSVYALMTQSTLPKPVNVKNCAARLKQ